LREDRDDDTAAKEYSPPRTGQVFRIALPCTSRGGEEHHEVVRTVCENVHMVLENELPRAR